MMPQGGNQHRSYGDGSPDASRRGITDAIGVDARTAKSMHGHGKPRIQPTTDNVEMEERNKYQNPDAALESLLAAATNVGQHAKCCSSHAKRLQQIGPA